MNASLCRTLVLVVAGLIVWGGWYGWMSWKTSQTINALKDVARSATLERLLSNPPEEVKSSVDLAVRGIMLSQGRDGQKSFDLKAQWATLDQKTGALTVREPDIVYLMHDEEGGEPGIITAQSNIGRIEDGNQKVTMSENVLAKHEKNILTGDLAVFLNPVNKLTFPGGADLNNPELSGTSNQLTWDLNTNIIIGDHGVKMRWYPTPREESSPLEPHDTAQPSDAVNGAHEAS